MEQLLNINIESIYKTEFEKYPICMEYFINLSKLVSHQEAYDILMIFPKFTNKSPDNIENRIKIIKYNYIWTIFLLNKHVNINLIKILLYEFIDYYYLELLYINQYYQDYNFSFEFMKKHLNNYTYISHYYIMRTAGINHLNSYKWSRNTDSTINNIVELTKHDYKELDFVSMARVLSTEQIDFLKLSRLAYTDVQTFNQYKLNIFNNAIQMNIINIEPFDDIDIFSKNIQEITISEI